MPREEIASRVSIGAIFPDLFQGPCGRLVRFPCPFAGLGQKCQL